MNAALDVYWSQMIPDYAEILLQFGLAPDGLLTSSAMQAVE